MTKLRWVGTHEAMEILGITNKVGFNGVIAPLLPSIDFAAKEKKGPGNKGWSSPRKRFDRQALERFAADPEWMAQRQKEMLEWHRQNAVATNFERKRKKEAS